MALSADRTTDIRPGDIYVYPMAAATNVIYGGSLVVLDASGNAESGATASGKIAVGRAEEQKTNAGAAAAETIEVRAGIFRWANSSGDPVTKANIGDSVFIEDDQTVCATATGKSPAGIMVDIDSLGVWVRTEAPVAMVTGLLAAQNLSDVGTQSTAQTNLALGTGDSPTFVGLTLTGGLTVATTLAVTGATALGGLVTCDAGVLPGPSADGILKVALVTVSNAELKALATTAIEVVAAVANKMHVFLGASLFLDYGSNVLVEPSAPDEPIFNYVDKNGVACSASCDATVIIAAAADAYAWVPGIQVEGATLAELVNVPICIWNSGGNWTGNVGADTILEVQVFYMELDVS